MRKRTMNRKELRDEFDAAERRKEEGEVDEDQEDAEEEEDEEGEEEAEAEAEVDATDEEADEEEEAKPKKRKAAAKEPKVAKPRSRTRTPKIVRMKMMWGVFNNSNQRVAVFDYPKRKEAEDKATQLTTDKKQTHFVQPVKEPIEEKKDKEKD